MSHNRPTKSYPHAIREKAVRLVTDGGYSLKQVAGKLGCSQESVRRWKATKKASLPILVAVILVLCEDLAGACFKDSLFSYA